MASIDNIILLVVGLCVPGVLWLKHVRKQRMRHIRETRLPAGIFDKLRKQRPDILPDHYPSIESALRDFFAAYLLSGGKPVSMPSQAADALWHEFILYTRNYEQFCRKSFGRFLHHTPAVVLSRHYERNVGLRRVWRHTCKLENINPHKPTRLPLLFFLDAHLGLADGFRYTLDCSGMREHQGGASNSAGAQCASDMRDSTFDGTIDGLGDGDGGSGGDSSSDGCGGGCGGD